MKNVQAGFDTLLEEDDVSVLPQTWTEQRLDFILLNCVFLKRGELRIQLSKCTFGIIVNVLKQVWRGRLKLH